MMSFRTVLAPIVLALSLLAAPASAEPTLWVARSGQAVVYLFGTAHMLPPDLAWRSPELDRALKESAEVWTETPVPLSRKDGAVGLDGEGAQRIRQLTMELGVQSDGPLSARLTPEEAKAMQAIAAEIGIPAAALDRMRPWLAATQLGGANSRRVGWSPPAGADVTLLAEAQDAGKPIRTLETNEQQLHLLADLPPEVELAYLRQTIAQSGQAKARLETLARLWAAGEDDRIEAFVNGNVRAASPELYARIVTARNRAWTPRIAELLKTPGVKFVAVGDGHVVGPGGLVALLKGQGARLERVR